MDATPPKGKRLRILWIKSGPLHPLDTGGKLRTYNMLRELHHRHEVTFLALCPDDTTSQSLESASEYCSHAEWIPWNPAPQGSLGLGWDLLRTTLFSQLPYAIAKYRSRAMTQWLVEADRSGSYDLVICDFLAPAINALPALENRRLPWVLFQHNVESRIWERHARHASGWLRKIFFTMQWKRMEAFEAGASSRFDGVIAVSESDAESFRSEMHLDNVLGAVPTGVDLEYFSQVEQASGKTAQPPAIGFLGSMDWMPNQDAVRYYDESIHPRVKAALPGIQVHLIGRNPPDWMRQLASRDPSYIVTGTVPDVRPHLAATPIQMVPLRIGGGTRIKIFEAMAASRAVVSTTVGAEGLPVESGKNILLEDDPAAFADQLIRLVQEPDRLRGIAEAGRSMVAAQFSWGSVTDTFETLLGQACTPSKEAS